MTDKLPPNLLALFAPRPQLRYLPPADHPPEDRRTHRITGVAQYMSDLRAKAAKAKAVEEGAEIAADDPEPETKPTVSHLEKRDATIREKAAHQKWLTQEGWQQLFKPKDDPNIRGDGFKTMFIGRLSYDTDIKDLEKEFARFGPIERIRIVTNNGKSEKPGRVSKKGKSRGYAFVVFEHERDFKGTRT